MTFQADDELLSRLCDPLNRQPLRLVSDDELAALRQRIFDGTAQHSGSAETFEAALLARDGRRAYPIVEGVPYLVVGEVIDLEPPL